MRLISALLPLLLIVSGCSNAPVEEYPSVQREMDAILQEAQPVAMEQTAVIHQDIPVVINQALLPPLTVDVPDQPAINLEPRFNVKVKELSADDFFMGLIEDTDYSIVLSPGIKGGTITLSLQSVTVPEVLETVKSVYGYDYQPITGGYMILPSSIRTQIFQIDYLNISRDGTSRTTVSFGQLSTQDNNAISGSDISTTTKADFWTELQQTLLNIVGTAEGRKVVISPQTGVIAVHAMPKELRSVEQFLGSLQTNLRRQVLLEAKILEVELNDGSQSGINWSTMFEPKTGSSIVAGQSGSSGSVLDSGLVNTSTAAVGKFAQVALDTAAFGGVFGLAFNFNDFTAMIELLKTQGAVRVLSSPRVSTINNQKAVIKVGTDEFYVTDIGTTTTTGTTATTSQDVELTPFFSGISLDVTPQINQTGEVVLHVHPSVVEVVDGSKNLPTGNNTTTSVPLAKSSVRESDSIVIAQDGQVVVIGGLMKSRQKQDDASTPGASDLPVAGNLFKHQRSAVKKLELVILLKPTVIRGQESWRNELKQTAQRFKRLSIQ
ncbi:MAG: pilus (MSHA type) biogenesis protein MshL [Gammaproteobacteria bacterium]|jgi:MSHA biogenesis protein MshL|nr:pilus (MSHA type) biogenesis protein MshL [Gammaproteobacteria bacterium]MBT4607729.1 pilus (MSHA type) biogenesis protein MshL [Thiotrichales bacterium]MBT3472909.1 pilus (MSHA type) biogenesis protein MshL [Gammaproteobacteria bacterium]MBT3966573.1 pilus (MSHA type) biogenesis protein MshL [Gammaproteobacteria bacterium]MBT4081731.1 pilus (MSHA type) biogenesis protein MshL [Gammaproteobacteria bacterium]